MPGEERFYKLKVSFEVRPVFKDANGYERWSDERLSIEDNLELGSGLELTAALQVIAEINDVLRHIREAK